MNQAAAPESRTRTFAAPLVFLFYLALAVAMTWPMAARPHHYVISEHLDVSTAFYNLWWFHQAVCELSTTPWTNPLINYPHGSSMALFPVWIPYDAMALPILEAMGPEALPVAFNYIAILVFALVGFAGFWLARYLTRSPGAAITAGIILAANPFRMWNITRWHATCLEMVAMALYCFIRMVKDGQKRHTAGFVFFVTLLVYTSPPFTGDLALMLAIVLPFLLWGSPRPQLFNALKKMALSGGIICFLASPYLVRVGVEMVSQPVEISQTDDLRESFSANLAGFFLPGSTQKVYQGLAPHLPASDPELKRQNGIIGYETFLGVTVILLALLGAAARAKKALPYTIVALFFVMLSMGTVLHIGNTTHDLPMLYDLLKPVLPWLTLERAPVRHLGMALVGIAILAAFGLEALAKGAGGRKKFTIFAVAALAVVVEYNQAPLALDRIPVPAFVYTMQKDPAPGAVLNLPELPDIKRISGYHHMNHGRPLIFQLASRGLEKERLASALYQYLDQPQTWIGLDGRKRAMALRDLELELDSREVRYVVIFKKFLEPEDLAILRQVFAAMGPEEVMVDDGHYLVFRLV